MPIFEYLDRYSNNSKDINDFYNKDNIVGYILPNGEIMEVRNHNIESVETVLKMSLDFLENDYANKDKFLDKDSNNPIMQLVINYLNNKDYNELMALKRFINQYNLEIKNLLVGLFGCHIISRLDRQIITASGNHEKFYNYMLHGFKIYTVDSIKYDKSKKEYSFVQEKDSNLELKNNIDEIKKDILDEDIDLLMKK